MCFGLERRDSFPSVRGSGRMCSSGCSPWQDFREGKKRASEREMYQLVILGPKILPLAKFVGSKYVTPEDFLSRGPGKATRISEDASGCAY